MFAMLARGRSEIRGANPGEDCARTLACCRALGLELVSGGPGAAPAAPLVLEGRGVLEEPAGILDCGNSGTTLRLLAGIVAARPFLSILAGDASLHHRPVGRIIEPLRQMGAELHARDGDRLPPLVVRGAALRAITYVLPIASAQVASCVLLAGLTAHGETRVHLPGPARDHTEKMLDAAGVKITNRPYPGGIRHVAVQGPVEPRPLAISVPGDFSAAAFFLAAAAAIPGARVTALGVGLNPKRMDFLNVLSGMGARVEIAGRAEEAGEDRGDVTVTGTENLVPYDIDPSRVPILIDEIPAWAIVASAAPGRSSVRGAAELRHKESDRITALVRGLTRLGITAHEHPDGFEIEGGIPRGGVVESDGDHRIAMAFAVIGARATGPVTIDDAASIPTSYPDFVDTFAALGGAVEPFNGMAADR
jgi:3-phosphoshikimate 1-carboxyvinyltransferase